MELRKHIIEWFYNLRKKIELTKSSDLVLTGKKGKSRYKDLAPTTNPQKIDEYFSALDWAFNNTNVHNIAIAGPYGAGKSSVINAYISRL